MSRPDTEQSLSFSTAAVSASPSAFQIAESQGRQLLCRLSRNSSAFTIPKARPQLQPEYVSVWKIAHGTLRVVYQLAIHGASTLPQQIVIRKLLCWIGERESVCAVLFQRQSLQLCTGSIKDLASVQSES